MFSKVVLEDPQAVVWVSEGFAEFMDKRAFEHLVPQPVVLMRMVILSISKGGIWLFQLILINQSYPSYPKLFSLPEVIQVI